MLEVSPLIGRPAVCSWSLVLALLGGMATYPAQVAGQPARSGHVQIGLGVLPGIGFQVGHVQPQAIYTIESEFHADGFPGFSGGEGTLTIGVGVGGAIRIFGVMRTLGGAPYAGRDVDVGLRFGPDLLFTTGESSRQENLRFDLFLEPFVRASSRFGGRRMRYFGEVGLHRPFFRIGIWISL